ncbi:hypothetical protein ISN45_Aa04g012630 [Arabidopsis thaliana x Arabidopsis arenosa]|uniref:Uncharacterized protein n=1 Tax=Arabidopsis thaliana x Arabidopsis arenosa TaxID=1240361 RepID=A0A8T2A6X7_9BRAS|nr:hypothetical protein ISN45_Aa04g012630 [Arabidopsis thaliana x Arabidopsis arenosa]
MELASFLGGVAATAALPRFNGFTLSQANAWKIRRVSFQFLVVGDFSDVPALRTVVSG